MKNLLLWEKWRPKTIEDLILLPRIKKHFQDGYLNQNYVFYGNAGTGKTTLARILIGKYTKDKAYLEINSSLYTSIDILRNDIESFCKTIPMLETEDPMKYVFLDEFERISPAYQEALKAFIEHYSSRVRFILCTNHIEKASSELLSRFSVINFDCQTPEEEKWIKTEFYKKISNDLKNDDKTVPKEILGKIINNKFPDLRSCIVQVDNYLLIGDIESSEANENSLKLKEQLYSVIYNKDMNYENIYNFLMDSFGADKIYIMIKMLSKDLIKWILENKNEDAEKLFEINYVIADYSLKLDTTDPIVLGMTIIGKIRKILN